MKTKEVKGPHTILCWSDNSILVEFVVMTQEDAALRAQAMVGTTDEEADEPCWQILDGHVMVSTRTAGKGARQ